MSDFDSNWESDSNSDSDSDFDSSSVFMNLVNFIFFDLYLHSSIYLVFHHLKSFF